MINLRIYALEIIVSIKDISGGKKKNKHFLKNHSNIYHFLELEKIHFTYFCVFENISYFKICRCFKKIYPKNMTFIKLENLDEAKDH